MIRNISIANNLKSLEAEAFRSLRTNLQFSNIDKDIKSIVITSSDPEEGKSTVSFNLAVSIAQTEKKVLLIDTDLRKPSVYADFEYQDIMGLTNIIAQDIDYKDVLQQYEELNNLDIITSGPIPPNPSEILESCKMRNLIQKLEHEYDITILDSPPIGVFADAAIISTMVGGVILVCAVGKTKRDSIGKSLGSLNKVNANLIGIVMNKVKLNGKSKYNAYYYKGK